VRGNHRGDIFRDRSDRVAYLERVEHYPERYRCIVYAYVLMSNHVHLLIETGAVGLSVQLYTAPSGGRTPPSRCIYDSPGIRGIR
jgi:hypothetical protein